MMEVGARATQRHSPKLEALGSSARFWFLAIDDFSGHPPENFARNQEH